MKETLIEMFKYLAILIVVIDSVIVWTDEEETITLKAFAVGVNMFMLWKLIE